MGAEEIVAVGLSIPTDVVGVCVDPALEVSPFETEVRLGTLSVCDLVVSELNEVEEPIGVTGS